MCALERERERERMSLPFLDVYSCLLSNGSARLEIKSREENKKSWRENRYREK